MLCIWYKFVFVQQTKWPKLYPKISLAIFSVNIHGNLRQQLTIFCENFHGTIVPPAIESDLGYRFRRRTVNPNPDPNPNPRTHPNPNPIFNRNWNKVFDRKQKRENRHRNIGQYRVIFPGFFAGQGVAVRKAPFPPPRSEDQLTI